MFKYRLHMQWARTSLFCISMLSGMSAQAAPCLKITLTGTQGGPLVFRGQAGVGTLIQYGDSDKGCNDVALRFDSGRGTTQRLSEVNVPVGKLDAKNQGPYPIPGGALSTTDYEEAVSVSGYKGATIVGTDLVSLILPRE